MSHVTDAPEVTLSTAELCARAEVSARQVDYWCRFGYLESVPRTPGQGYPRRYPTSEIAVARFLSVLVRWRGRGGHPTEVRVAEIGDLVRAGVRGQVDLFPGVILDLDVLCGK